MPSLISIIAGFCATFGFILIFASAKFQHYRIWRAIGSLLLGIPLAVLSYMYLGIKLAPHYGEPRFYSWPVGGGDYKVHDSVIVWSLLFWLAVWFVLLFAVSNLLPVERMAQRPPKEIAR
jgi:hypothetical protein